MCVWQLYKQICVLYVSSYMLYVFCMVYVYVFCSYVLGMYCGCMYIVCIHAVCICVMYLCAGCACVDFLFRLDDLMMTTIMMTMMTIMFVIIYLEFLQRSHFIYINRLFVSFGSFETSSCLYRLSWLWTLNCPPCLLDADVKGTGLQSSKSLHFGFSFASDGSS